MSIDVPISELIGKTLLSIVGKVGSEEIRFNTVDGEEYKMSHRQDCCESVSVEDICGDLNDLVGLPISQAEEVASDKEGPLNEHDESYTWTFYKLATSKGRVTIRWYGSSNGYYSERVDFERVG